MRSPRWVGSVLSLETRQNLSYRVDFWVNFAGSVVVQLGLAYFLWTAIFTYRDVSSIGGYSFAAMMLYYLLVPLLEKVTRGHEMGFMSREIYDGGLTRYLVYPVDYFGYKYVAQLSVSMLALLQLALGLGLYLLLFGLPEGVVLQIDQMAAGVLAAFAGGFLYFNIAACLEMVAFWADNVWSLLVMLRFCIRLLGGGLIPLALFPDWAERALELLPFSYLLSFPIRLFMGDEPVFSTGWLVLGAWTLITMALAKLIWWRGTLRYTGVGI